MSVSSDASRPYPDAVSRPVGENRHPVGAPVDEFSVHIHQNGDARGGTNVSVQVGLGEVVEGHVPVDQRDRNCSLRELCVMACSFFRASASEVK